MGDKDLLGQRHEIARLQSDFYRDQYRKMLRLILYSVFIIFALILCIIYLVLFKPVSPYYVNTTDGKILSMPPPQTQ